MMAHGTRRCRAVQQFSQHQRCLSIGSMNIPAAAPAAVNAAASRKETVQPNRSAIHGVRSCPIEIFTRSKYVKAPITKIHKITNQRILELAPATRLDSRGALWSRAFI